MGRKVKILLIISFDFNYLFFSNGYSKGIHGLKSLWVDLGIGCTPYPRSFHKEHKGLSVGANVFTRYNETYFSFRILKDIERFGEGPNPVEEINDLSILCGRKIFGTNLDYVVPLIGIGKVHFVKRGRQIYDIWSIDAEYEEIHIYKIGFSIAFLFQSNVKYSGVALYLFSNLNPEMSYLGFLITLGFGKYF